MRSLTPQDEELLEHARKAADRAYCPYSDFPVGAAVETDSGLFVGCNIENASFGLAVCAERVAIQSAVCAGARQIYRIAVCCKLAGLLDPVESRMPCGACRQVMAEFMPLESEVCVDGAGVWRLGELLPHAFQLPKE
jgi:cytidine deaminase